MNKTFKRVLSFLLVIITLCGVMTLASCHTEPLVIKDSDTCIVIRATDGDADKLLIDYMSELKTKGELNYEVNGGMIVSINGIENPADYSSCWMLYTSDADNASAAWGTVEYEGKEYGSAVVGAELLKIKPGQLYIWVFKPFN